MASLGIGATRKAEHVHIARRSNRVLIHHLLLDRPTAAVLEGIVQQLHGLILQIWREGSISRNVTMRPPSSQSFIH